MRLSKVIRITVDMLPQATALFQGYTLPLRLQKTDGAGKSNQTLTAKCYLYMSYVGAKASTKLSLLKCFQFLSIIPTKLILLKLCVKTQKFIYSFKFHYSMQSQVTCIIVFAVRVTKIALITPWVVAVRFVKSLLYLNTRNTCNTQLNLKSIDPLVLASNVLA